MRLDHPRSVRQVGDEQRREHEQVGDRLIDRLGVDHPPRRRCLRVLRHGQLHEPGEEEHGEQQHVVHLQAGRHLCHTKLMLLKAKDGSLIMSLRLREWITSLFVDVYDRAKGGAGGVRICSGSTSGRTSKPARSGELSVCFV